jgi:hypothetical protein
MRQIVGLTGLGKGSSSSDTVDVLVIDGTDAVRLTVSICTAKLSPEGARHIAHALLAAAERVELDDEVRVEQMSILNEPDLP